MTTPTLASPFTVGRLTLRNRIVSPPMERNYGTVDGRVTDRYTAYLRARAAGGAALLFTEATYVRPDGRGRVRQLGAHSDHVVPGLAALADAVHAEDALLGVELNHAGRVAEAVVTGFQAVAPSAVPFRGRIPRVLSTAEVEDIVAAFAEAARRCAAAGVDVVELHAAHGYLLHQFLSPRTNRRIDRYADPVRLLNEVLIAVRNAVPDITMFVRLSAFEGDDGGLTADDVLDLASRTRLDLVDAIDVSAGTYDAGEWIVQPGEIPRGVLAPYAANFRRFDRPVCVAGRITTAEAAEEILRTGQADLVAVGRALHADAAWSRKALAGECPRPCIGCNQGCIDKVHTQQPITCAVNPDTSFEWLPVPRTHETRRVVVVGAGVAGLEASRAAANRGHRITLLETASSIGGQFRLAAELPTRPEFGRLLDWYARELDHLGVDVRLSTTADARLLARLDPDVVVMASGGTGHTPPVPGVDTPRVVEIRTWLARRQQASADTVTVWGADRAGVAVADLVARTGGRVLLIGAQPELAPEAGHREKVLTVARLRNNPAVTVHLNTTVERIETDRLLLGRAGELAWHPVTGPVLISQGTVAHPVDVGDGRWTTYVVGEAAGATDAAQAIRHGASAARRIG